MKRLQLLSFLWFLRLSSPHTNIDQNLLTITSSICSNDILTSQSIPQCEPSLCIEVWSESMPLSWIETTKYTYHIDQRIGPIWNIFDQITCIISQKFLSTKKMTKCSCFLPKMTPKSAYLDFSLTHSIYYGDSTLRNFVTYMRKDLGQVGYHSLINDLSYHQAYQHADELLYPIQPYPKLNNLTSTILEYSNRLQHLPPLLPWWVDGLRSTNHCLNVSISSSSVMTYVQDAYEDLDESHVYYYADSINYCNHNPDRLLIFVVTGGLHYLTRLDASAQRNRKYELHILIAFYRLLQGVYSPDSISDCPSRAIFIWKIPNLISEDFVGANSYGESYDNYDISELRSLCRDSAFNRRGSENIAIRSQRVIDVINICLRSTLTDDEFYNHTSHRRLSVDLGIPLLRLCPRTMKGLFHRDGRNLTAVPSNILMFPGSEISYFLSQAGYPNDGRHYGLGMYLPFKRSLQGIAHEYAKATIEKENSLLTFVDSPNKKIRQKAAPLWDNRLQSCYNDIRLPETFRLRNKK